MESESPALSVGSAFTAALFHSLDNGFAARKAIGEKLPVGEQNKHVGRTIPSWLPCFILCLVRKDTLIVTDLYGDLVHLVLGYMCRLQALAWTTKMARDNNDTIFI